MGTENVEEVEMFVMSKSEEIPTTLMVLAGLELELVELVVLVE